MKYFYWVLRAFFYQAKIHFIKRRKFWILSRTACLFNDSYSLLGLNESIRYNIQKGRIDLWISYFRKEIQPASLSYLKYIKRDDIKYIFLQQKYFNLPKKNKPSLFVMDSFSELVDKKFVSKENTRKFFFSYFSDVDKAVFDEVNSEDLLPAERIFETYKLFFSLLRSYTLCPIVYIFFPDKLEKRDLYIDRAKVIKDSILLLSKIYDDFYIIDVPAEVVSSDVNDPNIYHFSKETYEFIANRFKELNFIPLL